MYIVLHDFMTVKWVVGVRGTEAAAEQDASLIIILNATVTWGSQAQTTVELRAWPLGALICGPSKNAHTSFVERLRLLRFIGADPRLSELTYNIVQSAAQKEASNVTPFSLLSWRSCS